MGEGEAPSGRSESTDFRDVYEAHFDWVWHALRRLSVPERDLADAAQNVFLVVHRRLPEFEGRSRLRTWIFQICRRVASDYRRSATVRREVATDNDILAAHADRQRLDELEPLPDDRSGLARALLDELPDTQREVFVLYELAQLSGEEIAKELGVPLGTVRSRLRLARETFRRRVAESCAAEDSGPHSAPRVLDADEPEASGISSSARALLGEGRR